MVYRLPIRLAFSFRVRRICREKKEEPALLSLTSLLTCFLQPKVTLEKQRILVQSYKLLIFAHERAEEIQNKLTKVVMVNVLANNCYTQPT